ncbi:TPA: ribonuclease [Bacillus cereus]|uniref:ribonuclease n=1 Tax=Bacillus cereus group TaxID=86661 RepID=UPI001F384C2C|nr:ribonuclease [Bacillus cereus]
MKKYMLPLSALVLSVGLVGCTDANNPEQQKAKEEEKQQKEQEKLEKKKQKEEEKERKKQEKEQEKLKKEEEKQQEEAKKEEVKKAKEEEKEQERLKKEEQKKQENAKKEEKQNNNDKVVYETEMKPKIDSMIKEYDEIWNQHWKPTWDEVNKNPNGTNKIELKSKMDVVSEKYDKISNDIVNFKYEDKLQDPTLKKHLTDFKKEFVLATGYRSNAAKVVTQGLKGLAPMDDRMQESIKSVKLSDEKLINALANMVTLEQKLGIKR